MFARSVNDQAKCWCRRDINVRLSSVISVVRKQIKDEKILTFNGAASVQVLFSVLLVSFWHIMNFNNFIFRHNKCLEFEVRSSILMLLNPIEFQTKRSDSVGDVWDCGFLHFLWNSINEYFIMFSSCIQIDIFCISSRNGKWSFYSNRSVCGFNEPWKSDTFI